MAQDRITFRTDSVDKAEFERLTNALGLTASGALNLFIKTAVREQRIPFAISLQPQLTPEQRQEVTQTLQECQAVDMRLQPCREMQGRHFLPSSSGALGKTFLR